MCGPLDVVTSRERRLGHRGLQSQVDQPLLGLTWPQRGLPGPASCSLDAPGSWVEPPTPSSFPHLSPLPAALATQGSAVLPLIPGGPSGPLSLLGGHLHHGLAQPLSGKWIHFGTEVTNSSGRLTFPVPLGVRWASRLPDAHGGKVSAGARPGTLGRACGPLPRRSLQPHAPAWGGHTCAGAAGGGPAALRPWSSSIGRLLHRH